MTYTRERYNASKRPTWTPDELRAEFDRVQRGIPYPHAADVRDFQAFGRASYSGGTVSGPDEYAQLAKAFAAARDGGFALDIGDRSYRITAGLDVSNVPVIGNPILYPTGFTTEAVTATGSLGTYEALDSNATIGENRIVCSDLASLVVRGDVIRITSDADFNAAEAGIKQSEMKSVRNVSGTTIYLNEPLLDSYTTANGAKAAIVTLAQVDIRGKVTVVHSPALTSTGTRGAKFSYSQVRGWLDLRHCRGNGAAFVNSWRCDARVDTQDNHATGAGVAGYGISIQDATCYSYFRGVLAGCREAVDCSGVNNATGGVSWENHVTVHGIGTGSNAILGAHFNTGSIYWDDCTAEAGSHDLGGNAIIPSAIASGARRTYVNNITAIRCSVAATTFSDATAGPVEEFIVNGANLVDCEYAFNKGATSPRIETLVVRNVTGTQTDQEIAALNFLKGDVGQWTFENIHTSGGRLLAIATDVEDTPETITIDGFTCKGDGTTVDIDIKGVSLAANTSGTASVTRIRLWNGTIDGMYYAIKPDESLDLLELVNVHLDNSLQHIAPGAGVVIDHLKIRGGSARNSRHGSATQGVVAGAGTDGIGLLDVDGLEVDTDPYVVGASAGATHALIGTCKTDASFLGFVRSPGSGHLEYLSGSIEQPRYIRGAATPEGTVTAPVGCLYARRDGATQVTLYVKESGTGNTGWRPLSGGVLSPAQITANQDNYDPTGGAAVRTWRLTSDASRNITGFGSPLADRVLSIINVGAENIVLQNQNTGSSAANRIITGTGADVTLAADDTAMLWYDVTTGRWRIVGNY